jgi:DNA-binding Xre family transcriptional regulator
MNDRKLNKTEFADLVGFKESKWNKISNGYQSLNMHELSKIAEKLSYREIDIFTYPKKFYDIEKQDNDIKAQIVIELKDELKDDFLQLISGKSNLKIINN